MSFIQQKNKIKKMTETSSTSVSNTSAEAPSLHDSLKQVIAALPQIEAVHASKSRPTDPEYKVSSFNHKYATLCGYKYHYVEEGNPDGIPLILLHGFPDLWYGWRYQIRHLAKEGYRVIAVDNLGFGESDHPTCDIDNLDTYRAKNLASNLIELLDQKKIDKAVFIGHDWGASVAWRLGMHFPWRCHAIISIGFPHQTPSTEYVPPEATVQAHPQLRHFTAFQSREPETWFEGNPHTLAVAFFNAIYGDGEKNTNTEEKQYYIDQYTRSTFHGGLNLYRATTLNFQDDLPFAGKLYTVPSLLAIIDQDPLVTPEYVAMFSKDIFVELEQTHITEGGHNVLVENPVAVNKILSEYLAKFFDRTKSVQARRLSYPIE
ncbi:Alpha/Beta hydrolase protein [Lobosporangium transversale]|uniref:Alpha/Beta hydrolase protein n=1 Tax=Lobosporangium transversale TaxID=64571 RepID=A0A1Y2GST7_9FUNG|nr:Alpha/Beta hydrolase protein [Lobosporangium transversale]ORZ21873.1 Alpha/Beta hydrolase protein [Lobosporangium transversale]|eukprot:XP_021883124.1 Alpha/Beta hydrolase protein [Lobosporangium transversale]